MAKAKQSKPDAKAAATGKAGANPSGAAGNAEKPTKRKGAGKAQAAQSDNVPELLREVIQALGVIAARVESVRRTLWRMSEVRNYENKGDNGNADADGGKPEAADAGKPKAKGGKR